jgi:3-deoxy-D-arabino-heptulosonate 7-phosphate (DAHP) synthase
MNDRPTPETDACFDGPCLQYESRRARDFARRLERQRDELLDELTVIKTVASYPHHPNALHAIQSIAKNAIAAVKGGEG